MIQAINLDLLRPDIVIKNKEFLLFAELNTFINIITFGISMVYNSNW